MNEDELWMVLQAGVLVMTIAGLLVWLRWPWMKKKDHGHGHGHKKPKYIEISLTINGKVFPGGSEMPVELPVDKTALAAIEGKDGKGNPVTLTFDTPPTWTVSDGALLSITPAADGATAVVTPLVATGKATVSVTAQIGGKTFTGTSDEIDLAAGTLTSIGITLTVQ